MKKILLFVVLLSSVSAFAQTDIDKTSNDEIVIDSSKTPITISLKTEQHYLILDILTDVKSPRIAEYVKQLVRQTDSIYDPSKLITVTTESGLVSEIYQLLSIQREGIVSQPNEAMKTSLLPQVMGFTWLIAEISRIDAENASLRQQRIARGYQYARSLKY